LLGGFFFFALINSSNVFLLLRAKELGMSDLHILAAYIMYNLIYALSSYPFGVWVDTHGYKKLYLASIFVFALVYGLFGTPIAASWIIIALFAVYGIFSAVEDGVVKAWLSLHIEKEHRATGLGLYMFLTSFAFLIASTTTGFLWQTLGSAKTFSILSLSALFVLLYFFFITIEEKTQK
jgi:MFS family permease